MRIFVKIKLYFSSLIKSDSLLAMAVGLPLAIYRGVVWVVFKLYSTGFLKSHKVNAKVISVGNITFGGSGKTPLVEFLAKRLSARKENNVAVLMRGYGNDEKEMARRNLSSIPLRGGYRTPILIGRDRVKTAEQAIREYGAKTIILDDGFQHLRLKRDLDIVAIDAMDCSSNGTLIPSGILREPLSGLRRADIFVLTRCDEGEGLEAIKKTLRKINKDAPIFESSYKPIGLCEYPTGQMVECSFLKGERVALLSAIGNPRYFRRTCEKASLSILREFVFPDHHDYTEDEIEDVASECKRDNISCIIITEKDIVKLEKIIEDGGLLRFIKIYTLPIEVVIKDEMGFLKAISSKL